MGDALPFDRAPATDRQKCFAATGDRNPDACDRTGSWQGTIHLPEDQFIVGMGSSSLYVATEEDVETLTLSRHPWPDHYGASR